MALYPLAPSYFGVEHVAVLDHVSLGTALSIPGLATEPALVDVSLARHIVTDLHAHPEIGYEEVYTGGRVQGVGQQAAPADLVQRLLAVGLHAGSGAGRKHDNGTFEVGRHSNAPCYM